MTRIAVLSDTHGLLRPEVRKQLATAQVILHAGDLDRPDIVDELRDLGKDLYMVQGNNDWEWAISIPNHRTVTIDGVTFYIVHDKRDVPSTLSGVNVVIYGHSHKFAQEEKNGVLWLNPGSCGPQRFHQEVTMAMMEITDGAVSHVEQITFDV